MFGRLAPAFVANNVVAQIPKGNDGQQMWYHLWDSWAHIGKLGEPLSHAIVRRCHQGCIQLTGLRLLVLSEYLWKFYWTLERPLTDDGVIQLVGIELDRR